jgi:hypothetical protein
VHENGDEASEYEGWTILELMGHRRIIGYMTRQEIAARPFLRVDIPTDPPATQFYGPDSVYCLTPTTETFARRAASLNRIAPVTRWELPAPTPAPRDDEAIDAELVEPDEDDDRDGKNWDDQPLPF